MVNVIDTAMRKRVMHVTGTALVALLLAGCAGVGPAPDGAAGYQARVVSDDEGFTLREDARIDGEGERDFEQALRALGAGDTEQGIALLEKVTARSPNATAPYINLAIAYAKLHRFDKAEDNLKQALRLNPEHPVANNEYGMVLRKTGRFAEARAAYEKVLNRYPDFLPARKNLGVLCDLFLRDLECALANYRAYGAAVPEDKNVAIWIADLERRTAKQ